MQNRNTIINENGEKLAELAKAYPEYRWRYSDGGDVAFPWLMSLNRTVAYHGPEEGFVCWERGGPVRKILLCKVPEFLMGDFHKPDFS